MPAAHLLVRVSTAPAGAAPQRVVVPPGCQNVKTLLSCFTPLLAQHAPDAAQYALVVEFEEDPNGLSFSPEAFFDAILPFLHDSSQMGADSLLSSIPEAKFVPSEPPYPRAQINVLLVIMQSE